MRQTLFYIPHEIGGINLFGWGLALAGWLLFSALLFFFQARKHGMKKEITSFLPVVIVVSLVIIYVLPFLEYSYQGRVIGIPIRGYGMFLLAGIVAGVGLAADRARRMGLNPEVIFSLAFTLFLSGILGARLFYVIQKWEEFRNGSLLKIVNLTEGGLVVYGALIFGLLSAIWFFWRHRLPVLAMADLIAPSLVIGLALGRIGCLMNGCCYGGQCTQPWAITFPRLSSPYQAGESPPYANHHRQGLLHGIRIEADANNFPVLTWIDPASAAAASFSDIKIGPAGILDPPLPLHSILGTDILTAWKSLSPQEQAKRKPIDIAGDKLQFAGADITLTTDDGKRRNWSIDALPSASLPVHPTQIYSSINAFFLFLLLFSFYPYRRRDGEVIVLLLSLYSVSRFLLEIIRTDEGAIFGTGLTISQNVSLLILAGTAVFYFFYLIRQPKGSVLPLAAEEKK